MNDSFHSLLKRQLRQATSPDGQLDLDHLLKTISTTYSESDREISMTNHAMELMSTELLESNNALKSYAIDLKTTKDQYELASLGANDGLWDWDLQTNTVFYSNRWKEMLNIDEHSQFNSIEDWLSLIHSDFQEQVRSELFAHLSGELPRFEVEYQIICRNGQHKWFLTRGLAQRDSNGSAIRVAGSQTDVSIQKNHEHQLHHAAFHDDLTGLPNRSLFLDRLEHSIKRKQRLFTSGSSVIFIDLDRFKVVNDSMGHAFGDKLLIYVAKRLMNCIRPGDTLARLGGDEFVILLEDMSKKDEATQLAERILQNLREVFHVDEESIFISASLGISLISSEIQSADLVMRQADLAMYSAKANGKNQFSIYSEKNTFSIGHMKLEKDLRQALEREEFYLVYQPVIDLQNNKISSFEALIRWNHSEFGLIHPTQFIPLAEETGVINPLGLFVLNKACAQLNIWKNACPQAKDLGINVNLSLYQLSLSEITSELLNTISSYNLPKGSLKLEITETALAQNAEFCLNYLNMLKNYGVELCIDDFGTGFSSLNQLNLLPFDILKIDRTFVSRINMDDKSYRMIAGIITLAHSLNFKVVAEGIEYLEELVMLNKLRCDFGQGYYYSQPVNEEQALEMIILGMDYFKVNNPSLTG